jgi:hypothetical protein
MGYWRGDAIVDGGHGALKECKIYRNSELIRHYVPCLKLPLEYLTHDTLVYQQGVYDLCGSINSVTNNSFYEILPDSGVICHDIETEFVFSAPSTLMLQLGVRVGSPKENSITINWGDGASTVVSGNSLDTTITHDYSSKSSYNVTVISPYSTVLEVSPNVGGIITELVRFKGHYVPSDFMSSQSNMVMSDDVLGDDVYAIGEKAFSFCRKLDIDSLPQNLNYLGCNPFSSSIDLSSLHVLPSSLKILAEGAFGGSNITQLDCSDAEYLGKFALSSDVLVSVTLPPTLTELSPSLFSECESLPSVSLPSTLTSIGSYCFYRCYSLASITIPNNVTQIGDDAFYQCTSLTSIVIPNGVTTLGNSVFCDCDNLASVTLPSNLTSIGAYCFYSCDNLSSITIPNTVTTIGNSCFSYCSNLATLSLSSSIVSIGTNCFLNCTNLTDVYCDWYEGDVAGAPWGAPSTTTIHYLGYSSSSSSEESSSESSSGNSYNDGMRWLDENETAFNLAGLYRGGTSTSSATVANTEHNTTINDEWIVTCKADSSATGEMCVMGSAHANNHTNCSIWLNPTNNQVTFVFGDKTKSNQMVTTTDYDVTEFHTYRIKFSTKQAWIDDVLIGTSEALSSFSKQCPVYIFACGLKSASAGYNTTSLFNGIITDVTILTNGVTSNYYIPCYSYEIGGFGLYDEVNQEIKKCSSSTSPLYNYDVVWKILVDENKTYAFSAVFYDTDATIDWGDGTVETITCNNTSTAFSHIYATDGEYELHLEAPFSNNIFLTSSSQTMVREIVSLNSRSVPANFCMGGTNVTLPSDFFIGRYFVGSSSFRGCTSINFSNLGDDLVNIDDYAFMGCTSIGYVRISPKLRKIGSCAFYRCSDFDTNELPYGLKQIGSNAFYECSNLSITSIPGSLIVIGGYAFKGCTSIAISSITANAQIQQFAFEGCTSITSMSILFDDSLEHEGSVQGSAFKDCTGLVSLVLHGTSFSERAFFNCSSLETVEISADSLENWGYSGTFYNCESLTTVTFKTAFLELPSELFNNCPSITDIYCPWYEGDCLTDVDAPWGAPSTAIVHYLTSSSSEDSSSEESSSSSSSPKEVGWSITTGSSNTEYKFNLAKSEGVAVIDWGDGTTETITPASGNGTQYSHTYANAGSYNLVLVTDENTTKLVLSGNVVATDGTTSYYVDNNLVRNITRYDLDFISQSCCYNCKQLNFNANVISHVLSIGNYAFDNCENLALTSLPDGLTSIGNGVFYGCKKLAVSSLPSGVTSIGSNAFQLCSEITLSSLPSGITSIGERAFTRCSKITLSSLPNAITSIGDYTFTNCSGITLTSLPSGITSIGTCAFQNCTSLALTSLPSGLTAINDSTFYGCTNLALTSLPSGITSIASYAFSRCANLALTELPSNVTEIGYNAFWECTGLTSITFHSVPEDLSAHAFEDCTNLTDIYCPWYEGDIDDAPWGAPNTTTVHYLEASSSSEESSSSSSVPSRVPAGYVEGSALFVEYDDTNKPYIDTGLILSNQDVWEVTYASIGNYTDDVPIMGGSASQNSNNMYIAVNGGASTDNVTFVFGDQTINTTTIVTTVSDVSEFHTYKIDFVNKTAYVDDVLVGTASAVSGMANPKKLCLLGYWRGNSIYRSGHGAIKECKIYRNNELIRHYIPCMKLPLESYGKDSSYQHGLYDLCGSINSVTNNSFYEILPDSGVICHDIETEFVFDASSTLQLGIKVGSPKASSITINWGDGTNTIVSGNSLDTTITHDYSSTGEYNVTVVSPYSTQLKVSPTVNNVITELVRFNGYCVPSEFMTGQSNMMMSDNALGDDVYAIDDSAFKNCISLDISYLPSNITYLGCTAFYSASLMSLQTLPSSLKILAYGAFDSTDIVGLD